MQLKSLLAVFACTICLAQSDAPLRLGPFHNLQKPGSTAVLVELPDGTSAQPADFWFIEDGRKTSRASAAVEFRKSGWKAAFVVTLDVSRSLTVKEFAEVRMAAMQFVAQLQDPVAVVAFGDTADVLATFETPRDAAVSAISQLRPVGRRTRLYEALDKCLRQLEPRPLPERQRIIVISDGGEESQAGPDSIDGILARAERRRIAIDTIWIPRSTAGARNTLVRISERTDGYHNDAKTSAEIITTLSDVMRRVETAQVVTFTRKIDTAALTREVGIGVDRPAVASAILPLRIPASAPTRSWYDWFQSVAGFLGNVQTLWSLFGSIFGVAGIYAASFFLVKKYYPTYIGVFPVNPAHPFTKDSKAPANSLSAPVSPVVTGQSAPPRRAPRKTIVERDSSPLPEGRLVLEVVSGPLQGGRIPVENEYFVIGADSESDLALSEDEYVSAHHADIQLAEGRFVLTDHGSRNGTYLDGEKLESGPGRVLRSGQAIQIGASEFRVLLADERSAARAGASTGTVR